LCRGIKGRYDAMKPAIDYFQLTIEQREEVFILAINGTFGS